MNVIREIDHPERIIHGVRLFVRQNIWADGVNSYTVVNEQDEDTLGDEDFDHVPADEEIEAHFDFPSWRLAAAHAFHDAPEIGCTACEAIDPGTWRERYSDYINATEETP